MYHARKRSTICCRYSLESDAKNAEYPVTRTTRSGYAFGSSCAFSSFSFETQFMFISVPPACSWACIKATRASAPPALSRSPVSISRCSGAEFPYPACYSATAFAFKTGEKVSTPLANPGSGSEEWDIGSPANLPFGVASSTFP